MMPRYEFDPEFAGALSWVAMYRHHGLQVVPAKLPSEDRAWKRPITEWKEFEDRPIPDPVVARWYGPGGQFRNRTQMGAITGAASGGLWVIDTDVGPGKDGEEIWRTWLAVHNNGMEIETPTQITGGGGRQRFFKAPVGFIAPTFKTLNGLDSRGQGGFVVLPPSRHESGRDYVWAPGLELWEVDFAEAPAWLVEEVSKLSKGGGSERGPQPGHGQTQDAWGHTIDGREERMRDIVWGVACDLRRELGDADPIGHPRVSAEIERAWGLYLYEVKTTLPGVPNEEGLEKEGRGMTAFLERWTRAMRQWNDKLAEAAALPKPDPRPKGETSAVFDPWKRRGFPSFPIGKLPTGLAAWVDVQAQSLGVDPAGVAMSALTAISAALDQRFRVRMQRVADWYEPPRLWTVLVGNSATKKSPMITAAVAPLSKLQHRWRREREREYARACSLAEKPKEVIPPPAARRLTMNDATMEAAAKLLSEQPCGVLMLQDELAGFFDFGRYGSGIGAADRAFWVRAYTGGELIVDRKGPGGSFVIDDLLVAFLGGVQPERLRELQGLKSDGLLMRFLPINIEHGPRARDVEGSSVSTWYENLISYLANMKPQTFVMTDEALGYSQAFRDELEDAEAMFADDDSGFGAWLGKLRGVHGSLSLILHVTGNKEQAEFSPISLTSVQLAAEICRDFLIPHARIFYETVISEDAENETRKIASFILTSEATRFTYSELRSNVPLLAVRNQLDMTNRLWPFVTHGWLVEDGMPPNVRAWNLEPWVRDTFAARRADELIRRRERRERFKGKDS